ncbi:MAG: IclR family transcriptional regulator [Spirochaetales bacterium]|uniref:IclR family transcriptional regulator n=1 Tax=Candidatus Thalassospirochaeta sargassi TaxID=3119039 RepID=A0AAJ1IBM2_9SPIO|nr:IclR family transcriptional regulator [Spirochaetales bacterium]
MDRQNDINGKYIIPNLWRAIELLEYMSGKPEGQTISELAEALSLPTNSVFRILRTLSAKGYITQKHKRYEINSRLFALGAQAIAEESLFEKVIPVMRELRDELKETVIFGKISGDQGVILEQMQGIYPVKVVVEVGYNFPFHCSAPAKAIIAFLPEAEQKNMIEQCTFEKFTENTIINKQDFIVEISQVKRDGFAFDMEEADYDVRCLSAPIMNVRGYPVASLWITGPVSRLTREICREYAEILKQACGELSSSIGFSRN